MAKKNLSEVTKEIKMWLMLNDEITPKTLKDSIWNTLDYLVKFPKDLKVKVVKTNDISGLKFETKGGKYFITFNEEINSFVVESVRMKRKSILKDSLQFAGLEIQMKETISSKKIIPTPIKTQRDL